MKTMNRQTNESPRHRGGGLHLRLPAPSRLKATVLKGLRLLGMGFALTVGNFANAAEWSFDVNPYLWVANIELDTSLAGVSSSSSRSAEGFDTRISAGAMIAAQARYGPVGLWVDFAWIRLDTEAVNPGPAFSSVDLRSDFIHSTAALSYRLPLEGKFQVEALAGARIWHVNNDFNATGGTSPGFSGGDDHTWADPVVGGSLSYNFTKRWRADLKGLVGGFGVSAEIAGEVFVGVSYSFTDWFSATLGYRYLHEEYDRFDFNFDAHGFLLGLGFHF